MATWRSFWAGWRSAARLWPVVLLLYLVDATMALALALPPAAHLAGVFGRSAMAPELLGPVALDLLVEASEGLEGVPLPWPLYLLVPALSLLVGTFLRGGTLGALVRGPGPLRWTEFFADCARFFGRLLVLLLLFVPGLVAVGLLFLPASLLLGLVPASGDLAMVMTATRAALLAFLLFLLLAALDYARISLVLDPGQPLPRHLARGLGFLARLFPLAVALGLGFALAGGLIAAAYPALLALSPLFGALLPSLLAQQTVALLASWQRVATLGGEMALYREMAGHREG